VCNPESKLTKDAATDIRRFFNDLSR